MNSNCPCSHFLRSRLLRAGVRKTILKRWYKNMRVPDELLKRSRFEPSGIALQRDTGRYLIVSDDTGLQDTANEKAAIAFLMDEQGNVDKTSVRLTGVGEVNDLEAITDGGGNTLYMVSSQNISKKGKRPHNREAILRVSPPGRNLYRGRRSPLPLAPARIIYEV